MNSKPEVGTPATYQSGENSFGGVISEVSKSGHRVTWTRVRSGIPDGPYGFIHVFTRRRNGQYVVVGRSTAFYLDIGVARTSIDGGF